MLAYLRRLLSWLTVVAILATPAAASQWHFDGVERVVAISDIHGAYQPMVNTLQSAAVIDADLAWSAGKTHLVIVGDILDRGPSSRQAMDLLMRLEAEATAAGGKVHVLVGNHEAMNLVGDLRYVSKSEYSAFAQEERADDRERWFAEFAAKRAPPGKTPEELRELFDNSFPAGFFAHRRAFSAEGAYGRWLLDKPILVVINDTAFVHGGLSPMVGDVGLDGVNGTLRQEMVDYVADLEILYEAAALLPTDNFYNHRDILDRYIPPLDAGTQLLDSVASAKKLNGSEIHAYNGPLWYRGNAACSELIEADRLEAILASIGAQRVVIGHTPTNGRRIFERFGGTVIEVDTGMYGDYYKGSGNAVVFEGGHIAVINEAGPEARKIEPHPRRVGRRPADFLTASDIEDLLANGEIVSVTEDQAGRQVVRVTDGKHTIDGEFSRRAGRGFFPEAAAYRLDLLLGLDMVPVAVRRDLERHEGTLRFLVPGSLDEEARAAQGYGGGAQCPLPDQWEAMTVFDALIHNTGRFVHTIRYSPDSWQLLLVGHDKAFATNKNRPPHLADKQLVLTQRWRRALESLTDEVLVEQLGDVLDKRRISALGSRRDELLAEP